MTEGRKRVSEQEHNDVLFPFDRGFFCEQSLNVMLLKPLCWNISGQMHCFIRKGAADLADLIKQVI